MCLDIDNAIVELCDTYPWIISKVDKVHDLFQECQTAEQIVLTKELLARFVYVDENLRNQFYLRMAEYIVANYDDNTVLSGMSIGHEPDSGSIIIKHLEPLLYYKGLRNIRDVGRVSDLVGKKKKYRDKTKIIVVDEFCGTGKTIAGRVEYIKEHRPQVTEIHFCLMAGMKFALDSLHEQFADTHFFFAEELKRGIMENYSGDSLISNIQTMLHMEGLLSQKVNEKALDDYSMGYGNAQALIAFSQFGNIPNSVFPWFWWPLNKYDKERNRLFIRYENGL